MTTPVKKSLLPVLKELTPKTKEGLYVAGKDITCYKVVGNLLLTLTIPKNTRLVVPHDYKDVKIGECYNYKFRAEVVITKTIQRIDYQGRLVKVSLNSVRHSWTRDNKVTYKVGKKTYSKGEKGARFFNTDPLYSCTSGIHVFPTKAQAYYLNMGSLVIEALKKKRVPQYAKHLKLGFKRMPKNEQEID